MVRPGGKLASRPLHFFWLADCSGSMDFDGKIQALNNAAREALPHMRQVADQNPNAEVLVRVLSFSDGARWLAAQPEPVDRFTWTDLTAGGVTDMGKALSMVAAELRVPPMTNRALPPVLVLVSDGQPTDDFPKGLSELMSVPWGVKAVRIAIAIGRDADHDVLQRFIGNPEFKPLTARNPDDLVNYFRWASTVIKTVSTPANPGTSPASTGGTPIPTPPPPTSSVGGTTW